MHRVRLRPGVPHEQLPPNVVVQIFEIAGAVHLGVDINHAVRRQQAAPRAMDLHADNGDLPGRHAGRRRDAVDKIRLNTVHIGVKVRDGGGIERHDSRNALGVGADVARMAAATQLRRGARHRIRVPRTHGRGGGCQAVASVGA